MYKQFQYFINCRDEKCEGSILELFLQNPRESLVQTNFTILLILQMNQMLRKRLFGWQIWGLDFIVKAATCLWSFFINAHHCRGRRGIYMTCKFLEEDRSNYQARPSPQYCYYFSSSFLSQIIWYVKKCGFSLNIFKHSHQNCSCFWVLLDKNH